MISYDGADLLMFEFGVFTGVLYGAILSIDERRKKMWVDGELTLKVFEKEMIFY